MALAKAASLYLAPLLYLTALLMSLFAFLAPVILLHDRVALFTVKPSLALTQPQSSKSVDGASLFLGVLGSCSKTNNNAKLVCTVPNIDPLYDTRVLPASAPKLLFTAPTPAIPGLIAASLVLSAIFFASFILISFRSKMGKPGAVFDSPLLQRLSAWVGVFGFIIGLTAFYILRLWFGKVARDFNKSILSLGSQSPPLVAQTGNGFAMVWVAHAFFAVTVGMSLAKMNV